MKPNRALVETLLATSRAHHSLAATHKKNQDDWAKWYANHLLTKTDFNRLTERDWQPFELAEALLALDAAYSQANSKHHWSRYYAQRLSE